MRPLSTPTRVALVLGAADATAFAVLAGDPGAQRVLLLLPPIAAMALVLGTTGRARSAYRGLFLALAAAVVLSATATLLWVATPPDPDPGASSLSPADLVIGASLAAEIVFLLRWSRIWASVDHRGSLDAVIVAVGMSPAVWGLVIPARTDVEPALGTLVLLAYPAAALVALAMALRLLLVVGTLTRLHLLAFAWIGFAFLGDLGYAYYALRDDFVFGGQAWQVCWVLSWTCLVAMLLQSRVVAPLERPVAKPPSRRVRLPLIGVAALVPGVVLLARADDERLSAAALAAQVVVIALAMLRLSILMGDLREQRRAHEVLARLSAELAEQALTDPLTGLANRGAVNLALDHALSRRATRADRGAGLLVLDMDGFKPVNDALGHDAGDTVLVEIARRLDRTCRAADVVARPGGDEFAVVVDDCDAVELLHLAERLVAVLAEPHQVAGRALHVPASVGAALAVQQQSRSELFVQADTALYAAKARGGDGFALYDAEQHRGVLDRQELERDLRDALLHGEMALAYQPIIDLSTGSVCGAEALLRWNHPRRGAVPPSLFIPLAERLGVIGPLGTWVLREACAQLARWDADDHDLPPLRLAINLSRRQLDSEIATTVGQVLAASGVSPQRLLLEVTETALVDPSQDLSTRLHELKDLGCRLAVDDFGTGYSALIELRSLPVDTLKIDRAFVAGIASSPEELALATAVVQLANSLQKTTLAEGVETGAQLAHVLALGCQQAQGYLFSKPVPPEALAAYRRGKQVFLPRPS